MLPSNLCGHPTGQHTPLVGQSMDEARIFPIKIIKDIQ